MLPRFLGFQVLVCLYFDELLIYGCPYMWAILRRFTAHDCLQVNAWNFHTWHAMMQILSYHAQPSLIRRCDERTCHLPPDKLLQKARSMKIQTVGHRLLRRVMRSDRVWANWRANQFFDFRSSRNTQYLNVKMLDLMSIFSGVFLLFLSCAICCCCLRFAVWACYELWQPREGM